MSRSVVAIQDLSLQLQTREAPIDLVDRLSLTIREGECLGLMGESGSGKTLTGLCLMNLLPQGLIKVSQGSLSFQGQDLLALSHKARRKLAGLRMSMIFQDPMSSLSPFYPVGHQLREVLRLHQSQSYAAEQRSLLRLFSDVGLEPAASLLGQYPHELSGGQRQRVMIAIALANQPELLIADEPTTALDVTIQEQILSLLETHRRARPKLAMLVISHNYGLIARLADRVAVMYAGRIVEEAPTTELECQASHPYSRGLLQAVPLWDQPQRGTFATMKGQLQAPGPQRSALCDFRDRCPKVSYPCRELPLSYQPHQAGQRRVLCHLPETAILS